MKNRWIALMLALILIVPVGAAGEEAASETGDGAMIDFAYRLYAQMAAGGDQNIVISPVSVYIALSMAARGAQGETAQNFGEVLGMSPEEALTAAKDISKYLTDSDAETTFALANSLWADAAKIRVNPDFRRALSENLSAEVSEVSFADPSVVDRVNAWIEEKTMGMIPEMLDSIDPNAVALLINALYMDAKWAFPFDEKYTSEAAFYPANGNAVQTDFMTEHMPISYSIHDDNVIGAVIPYADQKLGFLAVMPKDGAVADIQISADVVNRWLDEMSEYREIDVTLPKFKAGYAADLRKALVGMGLKLPFDEVKADFSGMGEANNNISISRVLHEVAIEVAEGGTKAAAATIIEAKEAMAMMPETLVFDHPFLYAVIDLESRIPIFIGTFDSPQ